VVQKSIQDQSPLGRQLQMTILQVMIKKIVFPGQDFSVFSHDHFPKV